MQQLDDIKKKSVIDHAVEMGMAGRKKSGGWKKQLIALAAVVMIGIPVLGFTFPALAQHIPIIGGIFERVDLHEQDRLVGLAEYATTIDAHQYSDGVSITLSEAFFDGEQIYLTYLIESSRDLSNAGFQADFFFSDFGLIADGVGVSVSSAGVDINYQAIDDNSFVLIFVYSPSFLSTDITLANELEFYMNLGHLTTYGIREYRDRTNPEYILAEGPWNFRVVLELIGRDRIIVDRNITYGDFELNIYDITISPAGMMTMSYSYRTQIAPLGQDDLEVMWMMLHWDVKDDVGNWLMAGGTTDSSSDGEGWVVRGYKGLMSPRNGAQYLVVTPIIHIWNEATTRTDQNVEVVEKIELDSFVIDLVINDMTEVPSDEGEAPDEGDVPNEGDVPSEEYTPDLGEVDEVLNAEVFVELLVASGFSVGEIGRNEFSWLSAGTWFVRISDELIAIYEYDSNEEMLRDSNAISPCGTSIDYPGLPVEISWEYNPYWFKRDLIIVRYVGENNDIIDFLKEVFGDHFAGHGVSR